MRCFVKSVAALTATLAAAAALTAQQADRVDLAMVARIRAEAAERSKVLETFSYITDVAGARPTGSPAHKRAADYVRAKLAEWGMANARLEPFQFGRGWELQKFSLELTAPRVHVWPKKPSGRSRLDRRKRAARFCRTWKARPARSTKHAICVRSASIFHPCRASRFRRWWGRLTWSISGRA